MVGLVWERLSTLTPTKREARSTRPFLGQPAEMVTGDDCEMIISSISQAVHTPFSQQQAFNSFNARRR